MRHDTRDMIQEKGDMLQETCDRRQVLYSVQCTMITSTFSKIVMGEIFLKYTAQLRNFLMARICLQKMWHGGGALNLCGAVARWRGGAVAQWR